MSSGYQKGSPQILTNSIEIIADFDHFFPYFFFFSFLIELKTTIRLHM